MQNKIWISSLSKDKWDKYIHMYVSSVTWRLYVHTHLCRKKNRHLLLIFYGRSLNITFISNSPVADLTACWPIFHQLSSGGRIMSWPAIKQSQEWKGRMSNYNVKVSQVGFFFFFTYIYQTNQSFACEGRLFPFVSFNYHNGSVCV